MLSLLRRRPKTAVLALLLLILITYGAYCGVTMAKVRSFRKRPQRSQAVTYFQGNLPHNILARMIVFRRGDRDYNVDLLAWAHHSKLISDNFWNRWILEGNLVKAPEEECLDLLPHYPLTPSDQLMPLLKKALKQDRYQVLPVLSRSHTQEAGDIFREWVQERVVKPKNGKLFVAASGYLAQAGSPALPDLINSFWNQLTPSQQRMVVIRIAAHLSSEPQISNAIFAWANSTLFRANQPLDCGNTALMGQFLSINSLRENTVQLINKNAPNIKPKRIPLLLHPARKEELPQVASLVINQLKDRNPEAVFEVFHHVAHEDIKTAETLAEPFLSTADSEMRKGVIVMLVRHGSARGRELINESFTGSAPRKTLYQTPLVYETGNSAADSYRRLSTHDYRETGKTWPPTYYGKKPSADEVAGWRKFIESYPWFPATDDAYYRLAFSQFAQEDYPACFATIREYLKRGYWPDNDVKPFMMHLLRELVLVSNVADNELAFARHIRTIAGNPLGLMMLGSQENISSVIDSINWFLSKPEYLQFLNTDARTLEIMRDVAEEIRDSPSDSVCRLAATKIEGVNRYPTSTDGPQDSENYEEDFAEDGEEGADDEEVVRILGLCSAENYSEDQEALYPATVAQSVLYGIFGHFPLPGPSAMRIDIPLDPSETSIRQVASYLNEQFKGASIEDVRGHGLDEMVVLALLHSGNDFEQRRQLFKPTLDFLSAVNGADIPEIVSGRHSDLLKERR